MNIGKRIRKLRIENDWTLEDLKNKSGLSISFLSDIERGVSNPSLEKLKILSSAFDVSMGYLLGENNIYKYNIPLIYNINQKKLKISSPKNSKSYSLEIIDLNNFDPKEIKRIQNKKKDTHFMIINNDNSMNESGIPTKSHLLIRKQSTVKNGKIAFLHLKEGNKFLLRKIYKNNDSLILLADNSQYETIIELKNNINIIGKVISSTYYFER